jgi:hypothetical protein
LMASDEAITRDFKAALGMVGIQHVPVAKWPTEKSRGWRTGVVTPSGPGFVFPMGIPAFGESMGHDGPSGSLSVHGQSCWTKNSIRFGQRSLTNLDLVDLFRLTLCIEDSVGLHAIFFPQPLALTHQQKHSSMTEHVM